VAFVPKTDRVAATKVPMSGPTKQKVSLKETSAQKHQAIQVQPDCLTATAIPSPLIEKLPGADFDNEI
jgi:hypothetical protein